ncbi:glycine cleavage system aminomethyltransferase GcvT [Microvirga brassicacearum]|uniref:aminomethyltransferase n=1 Tax=Microvirga brassicacearum TaxID=2580413 RepID=A0A5N3P456_9HYPH|nr:glycine cleavage system aminomethyltransferase GcvT [Microvirga brassicacearum]KAB0264510.1 glycine cleavage system aminomethyltransferase GcvT [Microvirga brassicacearum]
MAEPVHADETLLKTPLHAEHVAVGARMVPFAGYDMPVQYPTGILTEHNWTREHAGLFDVSHMGQALLIAEDKSHETVARALETLIPADILNLKPGQQRYSQLLDDKGGILDDLMVSRSADEGDSGRLMLVVNASMKDADYAHIQAHLPNGVTLKRLDDRALIALQGPKAVEVMAKLAPETAGMTFMAARTMKVAGLDCHVSRSGYTGEDGFEISVPADKAAELWRAILADSEVKPIGLGARDSLRLEAGLCLYGHDIDPTTSPIEAGLIWSIQKRRREEGGFPGAARIQQEIKDGPSRVRVGLKPEGRAPAREGAIIATPDGREVGIVTSGGFGPTVNGPVAMGYVSRDVSSVGTDLHLVVRGKPMPAKVAAMPFAPHRYKR